MEKKLNFDDTLKLLQECKIPTNISKAALSRIVWAVEISKPPAKHTNIVLHSRQGLAIEEANLIAAKDSGHDIRGLKVALKYIGVFRYRTLKGHIVVITVRKHKLKDLLKEDEEITNAL